MLEQHKFPREFNWLDIGSAGVLTKPLESPYYALEVEQGMESHFKLSLTVKECAGLATPAAGN